MDKFERNPSLDKQIAYARRKQEIAEASFRNVEQYPSSNELQNVSLTITFLNEIEMYKAIGQNLIGLRMQEQSEESSKSYLDKLLYHKDQIDKRNHPKITTNAEWDALPWIVRIWNQMFSPKIWPILLLFAFASCTATTVNVTECIVDKPAGFWMGLWHGIICGITFIISLFNDDIAIYAINNSGGWYDFGYLIGCGALLSGGSKASRR